MLNHIAIIMDGNGRWATEKGRPRVFGHIKGARVAKKIITQSVELGIKHLTLYAFSTENWNRPPTEVNFLIQLLQRYLARERHHLFQQNIRFKVIGDYHKFPSIVVREIELTMEQTKDNTGMNLSFALNYGGRQELIYVMRELAQKVQRGEMQPEEITEQIVSRVLEDHSVGEPDLLIRTSGEYRLSNFLLWQATYSELYFTSVLWPDFSEVHLLEAIQSYSQRERRFGLISEQIESDESLQKGMESESRQKKINGLSSNQSFKVDPANPLKDTVNSLFFNSGTLIDEDSKGLVEKSILDRFHVLNSSYEALIGCGAETLAQQTQGGRE